MAGANTSTADPNAAIAAPTLADRPEMPDGYGVPEDDSGILAWAAVEERLVGSLHYWMATTRPDGRPHAVPRWGVWLDGGLFYDGAPSTRHVRNLTGNGACVLHLEDGERAVIIEGTSGPTSSPGPQLGRRISAAMKAKYGTRGYEPEPDAWEGEGAGGLCRFVPTKVLAWTSCPTDVTRMRFAAEA